MPISLTNTLSGHKETFTPIVPGQVHMYHCGPTVYDFAHIGNMRSYIFADIVRKTFEINNFKVLQVINITDVGHLVSDGDDGQDKIERAAKAGKMTAQEITHKYYQAFRDDLTRLNIETSGTIFPWATEHIKEQIDLIQKLEAKGYTYITNDGVYFDTSKFAAYGMLGNIDIEGLKEGARIGINSEKKNVTDFALWKFSPKEDQRLQEWDSPWGKGFPGWHVECSAMSMKYLGETFDIHTGGIDHIPVHHNNEIAQSTCATDKPYVHYWLHNAFMRVNDEKMSKSLGNIYKVSDLVEKNINPLALRYWFLTARYSTQVNFTWESLEDSARALEKINRWYSNLARPSQDTVVPDNTYRESFLEKISDDFDTPNALSLLWQLSKDSELGEEIKYSTAHFMNQVLGILETKEIKEFSPDIKELIINREKARSTKDWKTSDELRDKLLALNIKIEDAPGGGKYSF